MKKKQTIKSLWTRDDVKTHLKEIDISGTQFSAALKHSKNFVTDTKRFGVPLYVEIILTLAVEYKRSGGDAKTILEKFANQV